MSSRRPPKAPGRTQKAAQPNPILSGGAAPSSSGCGGGPAVDMSTIDSDVVLRESREKRADKVFEINLDNRRVAAISNLDRFPAIRTLKLGYAIRCIVLQQCLWGLCSSSQPWTRIERDRQHLCFFKQIFKELIISSLQQSIKY